MANSLYDLWGGGGYGGYGGGMPYNTLAGLGLGLMSGTVGDPYGPAMRGFAQGSQADAANQYRMAQMRQHQEDRAQAQRNADRSYKLQERQFDEAGWTPGTYKDSNTDQEYPYQQNRRTGETRWLFGSPQSAMAPGGSPNPYAYPGKPLTEAQSKDALYASRMFGAEKVLRDPAVSEAGGDPLQRGLNAVPGVGNYMTSGNFQAFDQASRDFINATLRRESGAVISDKEFDNAYKQYLPRPGDSPQVLAQKRANRIEAIKGIAAGAGKNYRVPYTFDDNGDLVEAGTSKAFGPSKSDKGGWTDLGNGVRIRQK